MIGNVRAERIEPQGVIGSKQRICPNIAGPHFYKLRIRRLCVRITPGANQVLEPIGELFR